MLVSPPRVFPLEGLINTFINAHIQRKNSDRATIL